MDFLGGAGVVAGLGGVYRTILDHGSAALRKELQDMMTDRRAKLVADLALLPDAETCNIWRRNKEAVDKGEEYRFVGLLSKLYGDDTIPPKFRRETLKSLNKMPDEQFWQALYMLEHDTFQQVSHQLMAKAVKLATGDTRFLKELFAHVGIDVEKAYQKTDEALTPTVASIADWLEKIQKRRAR
jgi:hypothetical protein